jgi:energy-coupling factor transporter transmembrane protein EcfT
MSGVFAVTRLGTTWESALVIVEKGAISSLTLLLVVATTPSPELFRAIRRVMPGLLADMLFLAYRSIFLLLGRALAARDALKLRGGRVSVVQRLRRGGLVGALAVLRATELASDQYAAMRLRGYPGTRRTAPLAWRPRPDLLVLAGAGLVLMAALLPVAQVRPLAFLALAPLLVVPLFLVGGSRWPSPQ